MYNIKYKKIPKIDEIQLKNLIQTVINGLDNPDFFIPYEETDYERMFDETYAPIYGAYDDEKLIAMAQLYVDQEAMKEYRELLDLPHDKICELGSALCLKEYRNHGIMKQLMAILKDLAIEQKYDYIVTMAHPDNTASNKMIEKIGLQYVKTTLVHEIFKRNLYQMKL